MARRIGWGLIGGLCGWLVILAPLILINALAYAVTISPGVLPILGAAALLLGIALGGLAAGALGGRGGGVWYSALAGVVAAALFAGSLIELMNILRAQHELPYLLLFHPIRARIAIGFIACLALAVAIGAGAFSARRAQRALAERDAARERRPSGRRPSGPTPPPYPRSGSYSGPPRSPTPPPPGYRGSRESGPRQSGPYAPSHHPREQSSREGSSRW